MFKLLITISFLLLMLSFALWANMVDMPGINNQHHKINWHQRTTPQPVIEANVSGFSKYPETKFYLVKINIKNKTMIFKRIEGDSVPIGKLKDPALISWDKEFEKLKEGSRYNELNFDILKYVNLLQGKNLSVRDAIRIPYGIPPYMYSFHLQKTDPDTEGHLTQYYLANPDFTGSELEQESYNQHINPYVILGVFAEYNSFERLDSNLKANSIYFFLLFLITVLVEYLVLLGLFKPVCRVREAVDKKKLLSCCLIGVIISLSANWLLIPLLFIGTIRLVLFFIISLTVRIAILLNYLKIQFREAVVLSVACLLASYICGFFLYVYVYSYF